MFPLNEIAIAAASLLSAASAAGLGVPPNHDLTTRSGFKCDLPPVLDPSSDGLPSARQLFGNEDALKLQAARHSGIVQIPTISYDDNGDPGQDPRWDVFEQLHDKLSELYPKVHERMKRETVNQIGLVYTIDGSDPSLKPLMLAAHQDVVPVADEDDWKYPPFSGHFDGRRLWGRGASDDKNSLTGLMSALEALFDRENWSPRRTIVLALGFDEESSGRRGAGTIGPFLEDKFGKDSMAVILDEGGMGLQLLGKEVLYALPAVYEKGHIDVWLELYVNGGHSSIPFPHTGIGIMSEFVNRLEDHPWKPKIIEGSPLHRHAVCQARYSPKADPKLTRMVQKCDLKGLAQELSTYDRSTQYRMQTSQSVDYFNAGIKINAMPEYVKVGINHRVAPHNSIQEVKANIMEQIKPIVKKFGLSVKAFKGEDLNPENLDLMVQSLEPMYEVEYNGSLVLSSSQMTAVAPISPTEGPVWDIFSGTIQYTFDFPKGMVVPVGEAMTGNTDTRHYQGLTKNIYRWTPTRQGASLNMHAIDENIDMHAHMEALSFYYDFIRNFDASNTVKKEYPDEDEL